MANVLWDGSILQKSTINTTRFLRTVGRQHEPTSEKRAARNFQLQLRDRDLAPNLDKSRNFATQEGRKATGSHRILQACQSDLLRCQNLGAHDP